MKRTQIFRLSSWAGGAGGLLVAIAASVAAQACTTTQNELLPKDDSVASGTNRNSYGESAGGGVPADEEDGLATPSDVLDARTVDYAAALRIASLKLVGAVPTLERIKAFEAAADKKVFYDGEIARLLADPRFATSMMRFWQNTFKSGGEGQDGLSLDTAAAFAARTVVEDKPYTDLFTATTDTCPTFDAATNTFTSGSCASSGPTVGVLTDPGLMAQYFAPMAFRRVRFVQEAFVCSKLPVEYSQAAAPFGAGIYTGPYPIQSITGLENKPDARVDFHDSKSTVCVNCHVTLNHAAGLFANFDEKGAYDPTEIQVFLPDNSTAQLEDWLPAGESYSWRFGKPVADLTGYGQAMAQDPDVARCAVTRAWNFAFSRGNVVDDASPVPRTVSDPLLAAFQNGFKVKPLLQAIFTSDDFVKF